MRVIVTGSRDWNPGRAVYDALNALYMEKHDLLTVVHGGCPTGADYYAHMWMDPAAAGGDIAEEVFPADWEKHGKRAGPLRNAEMVKAGADLVLAFPLPGGKGTQHMIRIAREAGIPVKVWGEE